jgi:predicted Zn-dependent peptidase
MRQGTGLWRTIGGIPIVASRSDSKDGLVSVGLYFRGGMSEEPRHLAGITKALARTLSYPAFLRRRKSKAPALKENDWAVNPIVDLNYLGWSVRVRPSLIGEAMDLLSEFVQEAPVPQQILEDYQFRAVGWTARTHENAIQSSIAAALRGAYGDHPYALPDSGLAESVGNLCITNVTHWRRKLLCSPHAFVVVGPVVPTAIGFANSLSIESGVELQAPIPSWPTRPLAVCERRSWREIGLCVLLPVGGSCTTESPFHDLFATLICGRESRLFNELRFRRGLCYVASGFARIREHAGVIGVCAETGANDVAECRDAIIQELQRIGCGEVDEVAFNRAKQFLLRVSETNAASVEFRAQEMVANWFFRGRVSHGDHLRELATLSFESFAEKIRSWGQPAIPVTGLVGGDQTFGTGPEPESMASRLGHPD